MPLSSIITVTLCFCSFLGSVAGQGLNVTAIAAINGSSVLECWNLEGPPFGAAGALNYPLRNSTNAFLGILPPRTYIGQAFAPSVQ